MIDEALDIRFAGGTDPSRPAGLTRRQAGHIYGQQEVVKDLIAARLAAGGAMLFEAEATGLDGLTGDKPDDPFQA